ncbi:hypothetical protein [Micromonospora rhizosphaerae]|uniref:hypothetical protein n=1 Tax=Micromonospora rhizosphaerae TaxID=568872 RepID=UPI00114D135A|nr:hypothetical protein [Micromonospora rhizosphaerae]
MVPTTHEDRAGGEGERQAHLSDSRSSSAVGLLVLGHLNRALTLARYESMLRVHILPRFGDQHLDAISRNDVKAFALDLRAPVSVRSVVTLLGSCCGRRSRSITFASTPPEGSGCTKA